MGESKAPFPLGPMEGKQPESAATQPCSTCCPLSCSRWPLSHRAPRPSRRLPVKRLMAGHTCTAAVEPVNTMPGCRASSQSPVTTKEGKRGRPLWAPGHPCGCRPSWPALHLTRPPQGRQSHRHALEGISDARLGHGTQGLFQLSRALPHWGLARDSDIERTRAADKRKPRWGGAGPLQWTDTPHMVLV